MSTVHNLAHGEYFQVSNHVLLDLPVGIGIESRAPIELVSEVCFLLQTS